jgi:aromatic ring-opening dioxygenase catalytic subunit (LigB family)
MHEDRASRSKAMTDSRLPTFFIPHGGGPCFFMDWTMGPADTWDRMAAFLKGLADSLPRRPQAVLVISGHWECAEFSVTTGAHPALIYDYHGFPEHTYRLQYPAPGSPPLAEQVGALLNQAGFAVHGDAQRGFDHGLFVPFKLIYPQADIPIVQLSLKRGLDPAQHLRAGQALAPLRAQGVLIVGSGMSFHNLRAFGPAGTRDSEQFDVWLSDALAAPDAAKRDAALRQWAQAPSARSAHPREEHLLPLMVAAGAADGDGARKIYDDLVQGVRISAWRFG